MTNIIPEKISELTPISSFNLSDVIPVNQVNPTSQTGYSTRSGTIQQLNSLVAAAAGADSSALAVANGLNSNISLPVTERARITGPTGAFSIGGFANGSEGRRVRIYNAITQTLTIVNEDASSTASNRINTLTGGNLVMRPNGPSFVTLCYDGTSSRWIVESANGTLLG